MLEKFTNHELCIIKRCMEILLEDEWVYYSDMLSLFGVTPQKLREIVNAFPLLLSQQGRQSDILEDIGLSFATVDCAVINCIHNMYPFTRFPRWILEDHYGLNVSDVKPIIDKMLCLRGLPAYSTIPRQNRIGVNCWGPTGKPVGMHVFSEFSEDERTTLSRCIEIILEDEWITPDNMLTILSVSQQELARILAAFPLFTNGNGREVEVLSSINLSADTIECVITNCLDRLSSISRMPRWILEDHYGLRPEDVRLVKRKWRILHGLP